MSRDPALTLPSEGDFTDGVVTACAHCFCGACITEVLETPAAEDGGDVDGDAEDAEGAPRPKKMRKDERPCPTCRQPISADRLYDMRAFEPTDNELAARRDSARHSPMDVDDEAEVEEAIQSSSDEDEMPKKKKSAAASRKRKVVAVISDDDDSDLPDDAAPAAKKKVAISVDPDSDSDAAPIVRKKLRSAKSRRAAVVQDSEDDDEGTGDESDQAFIDDSDADERHDEYKGNTVSRGPRTTRSKTAPARKADKPKAKRAPKVRLRFCHSTDSSAEAGVRHRGLREVAVPAVDQDDQHVRGARAQLDRAPRGEDHHRPSALLRAR